MVAVASPVTRRSIFVPPGRYTSRPQAAAVERNLLVWGAASRSLQRACPSLACVASQRRGAPHVPVVAAAAAPSTTRWWFLRLTVEGGGLEPPPRRGPTLRRFVGHARHPISLQGPPLVGGAKPTPP